MKMKKVVGWFVMVFLLTVVAGCFSGGTSKKDEVPVKTQVTASKDEVLYQVVITPKSSSVKRGGPGGNTNPDGQNYGFDIYIPKMNYVDVPAWYDENQGKVFFDIMLYANTLQGYDGISYTLEQVTDYDMPIYTQDGNISGKIVSKELELTAETISYENVVVYYTSSLGSGAKNPSFKFTLKGKQKPGITLYPFHNREFYQIAQWAIDEGLTMGGESFWVSYENNTPLTLQQINNFAGLLGLTKFETLPNWKEFTKDLNITYLNYKPADTDPVGFWYLMYMLYKNPQLLNNSDSGDDTIDLGALLGS